MARNRKRAKERRSRRPAGQQSSRGVATRPERDVNRPEREPSEEQLDNGALAHDDPLPAPDAVEPPQAELGPEDLEKLEESEIPAALEHAAPDVELADIQIAMGRAEADASALPGDDDYDESQPPLSEEEFEAEEDTVDGAVTGRSGRAGHQLATAESSAPAHRTYPGHRLVNFLQGSWRELQRVQWPDRRQVVQATGVVIGFVIVAGLYLGAADTVATKLVNFLLK